MYTTTTTAAAELTRTDVLFGEDCKLAIDNLRQMIEIAELCGIDVDSESETMYAIENETDEALITAVVDGLFEDVTLKIRN